MDSCNKDISAKRIRENAPYRKSMSMTEIDLQRAAELERIYSRMYSSEAPFSFSKTVCKALEVAYQHALLPSFQGSGSVQQSAGRTAETLGKSVNIPEQPFKTSGQSFKTLDRAGMAGQVNLSQYEKDKLKRQELKKSKK